MTKKIQDIKREAQIKNIDLKGAAGARLQKPEKDKNTLYKKKTPIIEVKDLTGTEKEHFIYIKGEKFTPPKTIGNLMKIAVSGLLILLSINAINVYYTGKKLTRDISAEAYEGYSFLIDAGKSATKIQFDKAAEIFDKALGNFSEAKSELWFISTDQSYYAKNNNVGQAVNALLVGGQHFAKAGSYFLETLEEFNKIPLYFVSKNKSDGAKKSQNQPSITDAIKTGLDKTNLAITEISLASEQLAKIDESSLPSEIAGKITMAKKQIADISKTLEATSEHFPAILKLLARRQQKFQSSFKLSTSNFRGSKSLRCVIA